MSNNKQDAESPAPVTEVSKTNGATTHAASSSVPTAVPAVPEYDDFGLPIKKYISPEPEVTVEAEESESKKEDGSVKATDTNGDADAASVHSDQDKPQNTAEKSSTNEEKLAQMVGVQDAASDSDDGDFKDAKSVLDSLPVTPAPIEPGTKAEANKKLEQSQPPNGQKKEDEADTVTTVNEQIAVDKPVESIDKATTNDSNAQASEPATNGEIGTKSAEPAADTPTKGEPGHRREFSISSAANGVGVSEFSHQLLSMPAEDAKEKEEDGWQVMPSYAPYDIYDDDNRLIAKEHNEEEDEKYGYSGLGGAGKGYTKVLMDDDAQSATSLDDQTHYLFKNNVVGTSALDNDEEARDAVSQMQATKDLLTEGQRIAYVGVVRLEIVNMVKESEKLDMRKSTKKEVVLGAESTKMWGQKMMMRVYAHMDISSAEQIMIEQLAEHGVRPQDLTPALLVNSRVHNPMAEKRKSGSGRSSPQADSPPPYHEEKPAEVPPPYEAHPDEEMPEVKTPSQLPTTEKIDIDLRWTVLCDLFLTLIADSAYDSRSRVLLERVANSMDISWIDICKFEKRVTDALEMQQEADKENWNEEEHMEARRKAALKKRYLMMGLATVGGGLVIGLSAGLLAPVIGAGLAAGFTTIGVTGTSSFLAGAGGAAIITSSAAASGSIIGVRAANRRMGSVKTFEYRPLHNNKRVNLIVTVSGWMTGKVDDVRLPFSTVDPIMGDIYSVLWEPEMLTSMGDTINILATEALTQGLQQILGSTILVSLMAALQLPVVLTKLSYLIDNPWAVSLDRAVAAGRILADSLLERNLGTRPITLVGYSLGARVIFSCLKELAKKGAFGIVQNVYLFGSPVVVKTEEYIRAKTVVSGRFVNGYNRNDWILGYLFRLTNGGIRRVAGLAAIDDLPWIENMDVSELVAGHMEYRKAMPSLLMKCGWTVNSEEFSEIEDPDPENHSGRQRELINEIEEARKEIEEKGRSRKSGRFSLFGRKKRDKQEWEVYEDSHKETSSKVEDKEGNNHGVLFDIDAIRAELAREARAAGTEELEVKEIKSTLPPMKLDMSPKWSPPSPLPSRANELRDPLRGTRSAEVLPMRSSLDHRNSRDSTPLREYTKSHRSSNAYGYGYETSHQVDEIEMTFDTSYDFDKPARRTSKAASDDTADQQRPGIRTSKTVPSVPLADPWNDPDDEAFGQEGEISMTFA